MTEFTSHFPELAFYVNGARRQFIAGKYKTDVAAEVAVLRQLSDVSEVKSEEAPKPAAKKPAPAKRKPSAK